MYATSQSKADIQKIGMNFDNVLTLAQKAVGGKIHYVEITPEITENAKFLLQNSPGFDLDNNFVYAQTTKSILLTNDNRTKKYCDKIGYKYFWIPSDSNLSTQGKNQKEADEIREKLGVSNESAKPDIEHNIPIQKYKGYGGFDGNFNHCVGSGTN